MMIESQNFGENIYITSLQKQMKAIAECKSFLIKVSSQTFSGNIYTTIAKVATITGCLILNIFHFFSLYLAF